MVNPVYADSCNNVGITYTLDPVLDGGVAPEGQSSITVNFKGPSDGYYRLTFATLGIFNAVHTDPQQASGGDLSIPIQLVNGITNELNPGSHSGTLERSDTGTGNWSTYCDSVNYRVGYSGNECTLTYSPTDPHDNESMILRANRMSSGTYHLCFNSQDEGTITVDNSGTGTIQINPIGTPGKGDFGLFGSSGCSGDPNTPNAGVGFCKTTVTITPSAGAPPRQPEDPGTAGSDQNLNSYACIQNNSSGPNNSDQQCSKAAGIACQNGTGAGIQTAIGCIPTDPTGLIDGLLGFFVRAGGGVALLIMAFSAIGMITSQGNAEALKNAQGRFLNAVVGLLFIILAVAILQIVGIDILQIPGFTR